MISITPEQEAARTRFLDCVHDVCSTLGANTDGETKESIAFGFCFEFVASCCIAANYSEKRFTDLAQTVFRRTQAQLDAIASIQRIMK